MMIARRAVRWLIGADVLRVPQVYNYMRGEAGAVKEEAIEVDPDRHLYYKSAYVMNHPMGRWASGGPQRQIQRLRPVRFVQERLVADTSMIGLHVRNVFDVPRDAATNVRSGRAPIPRRPPGCRLSFPCLPLLTQSSSDRDAPPQSPLSPLSSLLSPPTSPLSSLLTQSSSVRDAPPQANMTGHVAVLGAEREYGKGPEPTQCYHASHAINAQCTH